MHRNNYFIKTIGINIDKSIFVGRTNSLPLTVQNVQEEDVQLEKYMCHAFALPYHF